MGPPLALVTGASSGIGATFARALARRGYGLVLVARRKDRLEALARELNGEALPADLTNAAELKLVEDRIAAAEDLELLVNNAGFGAMGRFWEADLDGQDRMHRLHVDATVRLTHAALRGMVARGRGGVINVSSVAGFVQSPGSTSYGATKRWMNAFTEGLYLELKSAGSPVKVQALCPGFTYSEFHDVAGMDRNLIAKSLWLRAEDVVEASLGGLARGDLFVIPGWRYKFLVRLLAVVPDGLRRWGTLRYARRMKRM
ncbi:MAG: SDR family NAD(P)-dependent oxidoreductase [Bryobacteraceae bacterium]